MNPAHDVSPLMSPQDFARWANVSTMSVYRWIARGDVRGIRLGKTWRIPQSELQRIAGSVPTRERERPAARTLAPTAPTAP